MSQTDNPNRDSRALRHRIYRTVRETIERHQLLTATSRVVVAVSGGVDSVVTAELLAQLGYRPILALIDHSNRDLSNERSCITKLAEQLQVQLIIRRVEPEVRASWEAAARDARYDALLEIADQQGCERIATGHNQNDQAETMLLRLIRGSGLDGLAGITPLWRGRIIRPLLDLRRDEIEAYATGRQLRWCEDPTNQEQTYTRNRVRHQLLPLLQEFNPQIIQRLASTSNAVREERQLLQALFSRLWTGDGVAGSIKLSELPVEATPSVLRRLLRMNPRFDELESRHYRALSRLMLSSDGSAGLDLPGGWRAERVYDELSLRHESSPGSPAAVLQDVNIPGPGDYLLPGGLLRVRLCTPAPELRSENRVEFDASTLQFPLQVRAHRTGERLSLPSVDGRRRISRLLIDRKVPAEQRAEVPVLVEGDRVLWVIGHRRSGLHPINAISERAIQCSYERTPHELDPDSPYNQDG